MTKEEIKQSVSMHEVVERYGYRINRNGFCKCPFHRAGNERTASLKIYRDSYYCFACSATGDVFSFVQSAESCDFKTAFAILGGTYSPDHKKTNMARLRAEKRQETRRIKLDRVNAKMQRAYKELHMFLRGEKVYEPMSEMWAYCQNKIVYLRYLTEELEKEWDVINDRFDRFA